MTTHGNNDVLALIDRALAEDIGGGDVTTDWVIAPEARTTARFITKQSGVVSGLDVVRMTFEQIDPAIRMDCPLRDGDRIESGLVFAGVSGPTRAILSGERTALNFIRHLSGVATLTNRYVQAVEGTQVTIIDTRKTLPGFRLLEKAAVRAGGGGNHRFGLFDMILLKDNHIAAAGGITAAVTLCRERMRTRRTDLKIEVETATLAQVEEAMALPVDRIMLDNMPLERMAAAVHLIRSNGTQRRRIEIEASGAITLERVRAVAETGVDLISIGALTHSAPALDIGLDIA